MRCIVIAIIIIILILIIIPVFFLNKEKFVNNYDGTNWMTKLNFNLPLNQMVIPGCHDSLTGCLNKTCNFKYSESFHGISTKDILKLIAPRYIITQKFSTVNQILNGARYIDLRLYWDGNDWYGVHAFKDFVTTQKITDVLSDLYNQFLIQPNKEIVILHFSIFLNGIENASTILNYMNKNWGTNYLVEKSNQVQPQSYQEITKNFKNNKALILWGSAFSGVPPAPILSNYVWYWPQIHDCWAGIGNIPALCCSTLPITNWDEIYSCYILPQLNIPSAKDIFKKIDCLYEQPSMSKSLKNILDLIKQSDLTLLQRAEIINKSLVKFLCNGSGNNTKCLNYIPPVRGLNILNMDGWDKKYLSSFFDINSRIMNS